VRGLRTKLNILRCNIPVFRYDYYMFTETWLSTDILDSELDLGNYNIYRNVVMIGAIRQVNALEEVA
jgi:hypothetical protein